MVYELKLLALQSPTQEFFGVFPNVGRVGFENNNNRCAVAKFAGADQAASSSIGCSRFHAVAIGHSLQDFVGVFEGNGAARIEAKGHVFCGHEGAKQGRAIGLARGDGHIASGRKLIGLSQAVRVLEAGLAHAELGGVGIHHGTEIFLAAADITSESARYIVGAFDHEHFEEFATGVCFTGFEVKLGWFALPIRCGDGDLFIDVSTFQHAERGNDFLGGRYLARDVGIFRIEHTTRADVDHDG